MTAICVTPNLDCHLAPKCERHFKNQPTATHPNQAYMVNLGDNAMFSCPAYRELDGWTTVYASQGALS